MVLQSGHALGVPGGTLLRLVDDDELTRIVTMHTVPVTWYELIHPSEPFDVVCAGIQRG